MEPHMSEKKSIELDHCSALNQMNFDASSSSSDPPVKIQEATVDQLPKEMNDMTIKVDKVNDHDEKVCHLVLVSISII